MPSRPRPRASRSDNAMTTAAASRFAAPALAVAVVSRSAASPTATASNGPPARPRARSRQRAEAWLADLLAARRRRATMRSCSPRPGTPRAPAMHARLAAAQRAGARAGRQPRAPSRDQHAGQRVPDDGAGGMAQRRAASRASTLDRRHRLSRRGRRGRGAAGLPLARDAAGLSRQRSSSNLVSALVRLSVIGQTDGQRVLAALAAAIAQRRDAGRRSPRSTISAARRSSPTSPRSPTKPRKRGCSGHEPRSPNGPLRVGIGGPVGAGKTALMEALCKRLRDATASSPSPTTSTRARTRRS